MKRFLALLPLLLFVGQAEAVTVEAAIGSTGSGTTASLSLGSASEGGLAVCLLVADDDGATGTTLAPTSGFTEVEEQNNGGFNLSAAIYYKVIGASETDPATFSVSNSVEWLGHCVILSDHGGFDTADLSTVDQTGTTFDAPSVTPSAADSLVVSIGATASFPAGDLTIPSSPNSPTQPTQSGTNSTAVKNIESAIFTHAASATGAVTWTNSESDQQMYGANFVVAPAGGGGSVIPVLHHQLRNQ